MKRIVTMQDISCIGKCSLTVALPVISAMGIETAVLPTAVLSTHTAFTGFTFHDLTAEIKPIMEHWKKEGFAFSSIYTGYLGSIQQLDIARKLFREFGKDATIIVDPCMADDGALYPGFNLDFVKAMAGLCAEADYICPNMTEASYLLNIPYINKGYDEAYIQDILRKLCNLGTKNAILTGVSLKPGRLGVYAMNGATGKTCQYYREEQPEHFHGTGDIWASALCGALTLGKSTEEAIQIATDFVVASIKCTLAEQDHNWYGVNFEQAIPELVARIKA